MLSSASIALRKSRDKAFDGKVPSENLMDKNKNQGKFSNVMATIY